MPTHQHEPRNSVPSLPDLSGHVPVLDGIRGLAISLVMIQHFTILKPRCLLDSVFDTVAHVGWTGVDLFFVLSGFLITGILHDSKPAPNFFRNFYARRVLRIFPLYYAVVFFALVLLPRIAQAKAASFGKISGDEWWYWAYLSNFSIARAGEFRHGMLDVSWSLAIEEQFYIVWPLVVWIFKRQTLLKVCAMLCAAAFALRGAMVLGAFGEVKSIVLYVLTPCRMDGLAMGAFLALLLRGNLNLAAWRHAARIALPLSLAAIGLIVFFAERHRSYDEAVATAFSKPFQTFGLTLTALASASLLLLSVSSAPGTVLHRVFTNSFLRTLGKYAYALYLFHVPIRAVIREKVYASEYFPGKLKFFTVLGSEIPAQFIFYAIALAASFAAAWISWQLFEQPILRLKRFFPSGAERIRASRADPQSQPHSRPASPS